MKDLQRVTTYLKGLIILAATVVMYYIAKFCSANMVSFSPSGDLAAVALITAIVLYIFLVVSVWTYEVK